MSKTRFYTEHEIEGVCVPCDAKSFGTGYHVTLSSKKLGVKSLVNRKIVVAVLKE